MARERVMRDIAPRKPNECPPVRKFSEEERSSQAKALMRLFDLWALTDRQQMRLLGNRYGTEVTIKQYRNGSPLANAPDLMSRAANLLAIHASLIRLYPANQQLAFSWITTPNGAFAERSPLDVMCSEGLTGIKQVRNHLEDRMLD